MNRLYTPLLSPSEAATTPLTGAHPSTVGRPARRTHWVNVGYDGRIRCEYDASLNEER